MCQSPQGLRYFKLNDILINVHCFVSSLPQAAIQSWIAALFILSQWDLFEQFLMLVAVMSAATSQDYSPNCSSTPFLVAQ